MPQLTATTFPIKNSDKKMTLVWVNDSSIPRGVKAFFRLDPRIHNRVKVRVKDDARILRGSQMGSIKGLLHTIARQHDYNWETLLEAAKRRQY